MNDGREGEARYSGILDLPSEPGNRCIRHYLMWAIMPDGRLRVSRGRSYIHPSFPSFTPEPNDRERPPVGPGADESA